MIKSRSRMSLLLTLVLMAAGSAAQAAEPLRSPAGDGLGRWIAAQGNLALAEVRQDLRRDLARQLHPLLPDAETVEADASSSPALIKVRAEAATPAPRAAATAQSL